MNPSVFLFTWLMPLWLFGQPPSTLKPHRASIGLGFSPTLGYRTIRPSTTDALVVADRNEQEIPQWGYDVSVTLSVPMRKRISLESGIGYAWRGYQTRWQALDWPPTVSDSPLSSKTRFLVLLHLTGH